MVVNNSNHSIDEHPSSPRVSSRGFFVMAVVALMTAAMLAQCITVSVWKDEQMYVTAGAMCLGQRMYGDFAFLQMPNLPLLLGGIHFLGGGGHFLLEARIVAFVFYMLAAWAIYAIAMRLTRRPWFGIGAAAIFAFNPTVAGVISYAYNLGPAIAVSLWGLHVMLGAIADNNRCLMRYFGGGLLFGLAVGFKLFFAAPALAALVFTVVAYPHAGLARRIGHAALFILGMGLALLPSIYYLFTAGDRFLFDNLGYHVLNSRWWASWPCAEAIDLPRKAWMLSCEAVRPANLALLVAVVVLYAISRKPMNRKATAFFCVMLFALSLPAAVSPSPAWPHYLAMPLAFGLVLCLVLFAAAVESGRARAAAIIMFIAVAITLGDGAAGLGRAAGKLPAPTRWPPLAVHLKAMEIRSKFSRWYYDEMTATLNPLYAVEAGLPLMPQFAACDFLYRNGDYLTAEQRKRYVTTSPRTVEELFAEVRPRVIIVVPGELRPGEPDMQQPLCEFAERNNYYSHEFDGVRVFLSRDRDNIREENDSVEQPSP